MRYCCFHDAKIGKNQGCWLLADELFLKVNGQQSTDFGYAVTEPVEVPHYAFDKLSHQISAFLCVSARDSHIRKRKQGMHPKAHSLF